MNNFQQFFGSLLFVCSAYISSASNKPNIIWVMGEDMGPELSCYGHPAVNTPNFDRMATEGARYTQSFCTAPSCTPSRNAMMTGVYQTRTDTQDQRRGGIVLPDGIKPITHLLRDAGYYTALGCGYSSKTDLNFKTQSLFDGKDWSGRKKGQPFFAQITLYSTHRLPDNWDKIHANSKNPVDPAKVKLPPYFPDHPVCRSDWARYLESIQYIDEQMGQILQRLEKEGIADNTVVIFIGDNGQCHLRGKCWLYDAGIKVPLIIRWPGKVQPGTLDNRLVSMIDVTATILDIAGVKLPDYLDGFPILGEKSRTREHIFAARDLVDEVMDHIRCVRTDRYKYIRNYTPENGYRECRYVRQNRPMYPVLKRMHEAGKLNKTEELLWLKTKPKEELYDVKNDPYEVNNLADNPAHREKLKELRGLLDHWLIDTNDAGLRSMQAANPPEKERRAKDAKKTKIPLDGTWRFAFDAGDHGLRGGPESWKFPESIDLPNTTARAKLGPAKKMSPVLSDPWVRILHQRHPYTGPAWYQKTVVIPADWKNKDVTLHLERVLWESRIWVNGKPAHAPQASLSVPHRYNLTNLIVPGKENTITMRIDNREIMPMGDIGHAYTNQTQSIWNGVVGKIKLIAEPKVRISHIRVRPQLDKSSLQVAVELTNTTGKPVLNQALNISIGKGGGEAYQIHSKKDPLKVSKGVTVQHFTIPLKKETLPKWSEFNPVTHRLRARLSGAGNDIKTVKFGYRSLTTDKKQLMMNGSPTFLRGNLECCIFPNTGHPDMNGKQWEKIFSTAKKWGLNHFRFHSWCPPKIAFEMADKHGMYLQVELPNWSFKMGQVPKLDAYFKAEGERIFREYGNHPSFVMFCLGNELKGDFKAMDQLVEHFRKIEPHLLYTSTAYSFTNRGLLPGPSDDFFITQRSKSGWVRGQGFLNENFPSTDTDYAPGLECLNIPLVTHEVGQYHVYPDLRELKKYTDSPLVPTAWQAIRDDLKSKNRLDLAARYTRDSGKLSALLYKEDMERALRTPGLSGIQLLQLQDFPGQGTATVGLLDSFWDSKGVTTPEEFSQFCSPTVPLVRMGRFVWENDETFRAKIEVAHFGAQALRKAPIHWRISKNGEAVLKGELAARDILQGSGTKLGEFSASLSSIKQATQLQLTISIAGNKNTWPLWVYPSEASSETPKSDVIIHRTLTKKALTDLAAGKNVLLAPISGAIKKPLAGRFIPIFWSPVHFKNQPGSIGSTILAEHPCWKNFPTDTHTNWQWWELTATSMSVDLEGIRGIDPRRDVPFAFIDKFNRNALPAAVFEAQVGRGRLLVCTLDIHSDLEKRIVARQLRHALVSYVASPDFNPKGTLTVDELKSLFGESGMVISASSAHPEYPATGATDGKPGTFWHTDWTKKHKFPHHLTIDLLSEKVIKGFKYIPRQDMDRGRIKDYAIQVSRDGQRWIPWGTKKTFPAGSAIQNVSYSKAVKTRYLRLVIYSEQTGNPFASCAEFTPIMADAEKASDLGIIPGFND
ncbi:MAG: sulfatase-like hydrolase/transferase [Akkermansiaceae bacterium]